jgi:hypothetical protein
MSRRLDVILHGYLWVLMSGLLVQGLGPYLIRGLFGIDFWHAWIHIGWGAAGVALLARRYTSYTAGTLALAFGAFYSVLAIVGVTIHHPFGLELDVFENGFHLVAGPTTLLLGGLSWRGLLLTQGARDAASA